MPRQLYIEKEATAESHNTTLHLLEEQHAGPQTPRGTDPSQGDTTQPELSRCWWKHALCFKVSLDFRENRTGGQVEEHEDEAEQE